MITTEAFLGPRLDEHTYGLIITDNLATLFQTLGCVASKEKSSKIKIMSL